MIESQVAIKGTVTVSCREKPTNMGMPEWFSQYKQYAPLAVTGVFGFVKEFSPLYGGRMFSGEEITEEDLNWLYDRGMGIKLTLTGAPATEELYEESKELLEKYERAGNTIAVVDDKLAKWIKRDYPEYLVEASVIKNIKWQDIEKTLEVYDALVLTMDKNDNFEELAKIKEKDKIILFGNAGCAYNCPSKICYPSISKLNKGVEGAKFQCSQEHKEREEVRLHNFDLSKLREAGFHNFKFVTVNKGRGF